MIRITPAEPREFELRCDECNRVLRYALPTRFLLITIRQRRILRRAAAKERWAHLPATDRDICPMCFKRSVT